LTGIIPLYKKFISKLATNLDRMSQIQYDQVWNDGISPCIQVISKYQVHRLVVSWGKPAACCEDSTVRVHPITRR